MPCWRMHWAAACSALAGAAPEPPLPCPPLPWPPGALWLRLGTTAEPPPEPPQPARRTTADVASTASADFTACLCTGSSSAVRSCSHGLFYAPRGDTGLTGKCRRDLRLLGRCHPGCERALLCPCHPGWGTMGSCECLLWRIRRCSPTA